ncbi:glutaredoxin 3 [Alkaliphilus metalliredigens QYMF]|uniref:Glutaredoxin n=1 Tax=Alkaliphilus metalliredigens (strain QYMF) TaxID=293826 RepID=A6TW36_ALKMQ|nr:glutaredoxin 3 [Alkaliphilus metalliredigens]ABR50404.1 glutaredoxin 3 [Alkaliphilus metalliredigens QYMF]
MKKVVLYTKDFCPFCHRALDLLKSKEVEFTNVDVTHDLETFKTVIKRTGSDTVPQIFIDDEFIGGCDDLIALDQEDTLDSKLGL